MTSLCFQVWIFAQEVYLTILCPAGVYETAKEYHARRLAAVLTIQCYMRGCLARRLFSKLQVERLKQKEAEREVLKQEKAEKEQKQQQELDRRTNPKKRSDFRLLFEELEDWFTKASMLSLFDVINKDSSLIFVGTTKDQRVLCIGTGNHSKSTGTSTATYTTAANNRETPNQSE